MRYINLLILIYLLTEHRRIEDVVQLGYSQIVSANKASDVRVR